MIETKGLGDGVRLSGVASPDLDLARSSPTTLVEALTKRLADLGSTPNGSTIESPRLHAMIKHGVEGFCLSCLRDPIYQEGRRSSSPEEKGARVFFLLSFVFGIERQQGF